MSRNQREGEDKFVFDQFSQIESTRQAQYVVIAFRIQCGSLLLSLDKSEAPIDCEIRAQRLQTSLAYQPYPCVDMKRQPDFRVACPPGHHFPRSVPDYGNMRVRGRFWMHLIQHSAKRMQ